MAYWHDIQRRRGNYCRYSSDGLAIQVVARQRENPEIFEAHFERGDSKSMNRDGWIEFWPILPIIADTAPEAIAKAATVLEMVAGRQHDAFFEQRPRPVPMWKKRVKQVDHPTYRVTAWIFRHSQELFEVRYFGDLAGSVETGWRLDVPPFDDFQNSIQYEGLTFADSLESAEEVATLELNLLVASNNQILPQSE